MKLLSKKVLILAIFIALPGCASFPPVALDLKMDMLGGLISVAPAITIGDGKIGPTDVEIEINKGVLGEDE